MIEKKYSLGRSASQLVTLPRDAVPGAVQLRGGGYELTVQTAGDRPDTDLARVSRLKTGDPVKKEHGRYLCTVLDEGSVWHFYIVFPLKTPE